MGCSRTPAATDGRHALLGLGRTQDGQWRVEGIAPDGVTDLAVVAADGRSVPVGIDNNAYGLVVPERPSAVTWIAPGGERMTRSLHGLY